MDISCLQSFDRSPTPGEPDEAKDDTADGLNKVALLNHFTLSPGVFTESENKKDDGVVA